MNKRIIIMILSILVFLSFSVSVYAEENQSDNKYGSISFTLVDKKENIPIVGAELALYYVANVELSSDDKLIYTYTDEFYHMEHSLDSDNISTHLEAFVIENNIAHTKITTDSSGKAFCDDLKAGFYFAMQTNIVEGYAKCTSFVVTLPSLNNGEYVFDIDASPKIEIEKLTDITIKKVWNTDETLNPAESVTVQLLYKGEVIETAVLNNENNWEITYKDLPESDEYSIKEVNVPKDFTETYSKNGFIFTVTNTSNLIQTGQNFWHIPIFASLGLLFIIMGFIILRKSRKAND